MNQYPTRNYSQLLLGLVVFVMSTSLVAAFLTRPFPHNIHAATRRQQYETATTFLSMTASDTRQQQQNHEFALLFDCDGVILETEELHRRAYNTAFEEFNLTIDGTPVVWDVRNVHA